MSEWLRVASIHDVPPGSSCEVTAAGRVFALFNVEGKIHALDGVCPHAGGPLGEGQLDGTVVTCPWHGWQFDVTTGQHCLNSHLQHISFEVRVDGDEIQVAIE